MPKSYDSIIIGAGIAGASIAYSLTQKGHTVLVLDKQGIALGGSGSAGAFISPKVAKASVLQSLTNEAFEFAKDFYLSVSPKYFHQTGILRIPKNYKDEQKFIEYEKYNTKCYEYYSKEKLKSLGLSCNFDGFYFPEAGDCDAKELCEFLLEDIEVLNYEVKALKSKDGLWSVGEYRAKNIILATGYESNLLDISYMGIHGIWGSRGDFSSALDLKISMHQNISIGANNKGLIKLGASHKRDIKSPKPCQKEEVLKLKEDASALIDTSDFVLEKVYCGMRAGSKDAFPLLGAIIDVPKMLKSYPQIRKGAKPKEIFHHKNLYIFNGLGGRGFVFAPLMAEILTEHILFQKALDKRMNPDRLFLKWCRKL